MKGALHTFRFTVRLGRAFPTCFSAMKMLLDFLKAVRFKLACAIFILVLIAPYIDTSLPKLHITAKLLSAVPLFLLFLLNDWRTDIDNRLKSIELGLNNPEPPTYKRFPEMEATLADTVDSLLADGGPIDIKVIGVSAKFSWPFFKAMIDRLLQSDRSNVELTLNIVVTHPNHLDEWGLSNWKRDCCNSLESFEAYLKKHCASLKAKGIKLYMYEYDNLPHWHGVMFNDSILFLGRTEWFQYGDLAEWELKVGEVEYRKFETVDSYGGTSRVNRYKLWFQRYTDRSRDKSWVHPDVAS